MSRCALDIYVLITILTYKMSNKTFFEHSSVFLFLPVRSAITADNQTISNNIMLCNVAMSISI